MQLFNIQAYLIPFPLIFLITDKEFKAESEVEWIKFEQWPDYN